MAINIKRLVYFEEFMDPTAARILDAQPEIELVRLEYASPVDDNWADMSRTLGYQTQSRVELKEPWFANANMIAHCPNLLAVSSTGAGYDMVDVDDCTKAGVIVCNQSGTNKEGVAEHALGLMLALSKKIATSDRAMRKVKDLVRRNYQGNDIKGKTLGVVGIGNIGSRRASGVDRTYATIRLRVGALPPHQRNLRHAGCRAVRGDATACVFYQYGAWWHS